MFALQITISDPLFWIMIFIAVMFLIMALSVVAVALAVSRLVATVRQLKERVEPLLINVNGLSEQGKLIAGQGREIAEQFTLMADNLSHATKYFSDSVGLVKDEVAEIKQIVGYSAESARDKVALVNRTIDETHKQVVTTTQFINSSVVEPAREIAAVLAGVRAGLEVLFAPAPKPIDRTYAEEELFIG